MSWSSTTTPTSACSCESCSSARASQVDEAEQRPGGPAALYAAPPALVLLDVSMPELDGYQTLERIRDLSEVPVIMLTARAQELEKVRGLSAGADDYVAKPFGRQELLARVQALLRRSGGRSTVNEAYADDFLEIDYAAAAGHRRRPRGPADAARVQAARGLRAEPQPGPLAATSS